MDSRRRIVRTLLIDADDTLWENNIYYLACTERFKQLMARQGLAPERTQVTLDRTEQELIPTQGYGPFSYVNALELTCRRLLAELDGKASEALAAEARACGALVLDPPMELLPGVHETLLALRPSSLLVLVTKGDQAHQRGKLTRSGLGPLFDHRYVVDEKRPSTYATIAQELALDSASTWMVGNSPRSDIDPAIEAGLGAIYIPHEHTWSAERAPLARPERTVQLAAFADLLDQFGLRPASQP